MEHHSCEKIKKLVKKKREREKKKITTLFPTGLEPATFRVLSGRDNHYTTETWCGDV